MQDFYLADDEKNSKDKDKEGSSSMMEGLSMKTRFVYVFGGINDKVARATCERLLILAEQSDKPINMLISSPGGHVESGDAIHDMIKFIGVPVNTIGSGWVASAGTHIFLAAPKERRMCLPNTRFMIHQPSGGAGGQATDIAIQAKEIVKTRERIAQTVADATGKPLAKVLEDIERDYWMSPKEAIEYGILSKVIKSKTEVS
jgi:ATP-dependent Clp protease, protease subunit